VPWQKQAKAIQTWDIGIVPGGEDRELSSTMFKTHSGDRAVEILIVDQEELFNGTVQDE
jgi:hypothetical protein